MMKTRETHTRMTTDGGQWGQLDFGGLRSWQHSSGGSQSSEHHFASFSRGLNQCSVARSRSPRQCWSWASGLGTLGLEVLPLSTACRWVIETAGGWGQGSPGCSCVWSVTDLAAC